MSSPSEEPVPRTVIDIKLEPPFVNEFNLGEPCNGTRLPFVLRLSRLRDDHILRLYLRHYFGACVVVLVVSTTRCPWSPERRKFSVVSSYCILPFALCPLPLIALFCFSFDSFSVEIKLFKPYGHPRRYRN